MRTLYVVSLAYRRATTARTPSLGEAAVSVKNTDGRRRIYKKNGTKSVTEREEKFQAGQKRARGIEDLGCGPRADRGYHAVAGRSGARTCVLRV